MDVLVYSAKCVLPLILMMAVGYGLKKIGILKEGFVAQANQFCFKVTLPIQLFCSIAKQSMKGFNGGLIGFASAAILAVAGILCLIVPRVEKSRPAAASEIQGIFRSNFLLFGLPLAVNMFGDEGMLPTALLLPVAIPLFNILAVLILSYFGKENGKLNLKGTLLSIAKNPLIIASLLGIVVSLLPFSLPEVVNKPLSDIGSTATPMALMMLGAQFDFRRLRGNLKKALLCTAMRLLAVPAVVLTGAILLGFRGPELGAIFILFSAPTAVSSYVMAQNMDADSDLAGQLVVLTTLCAGVTLFALMSVLKFFALI